ncbi:MAG: class I SAM-dependent DNA methyltransferase [Candidatus Dormibacteria bacterium]
MISTAQQSVLYWCPLDRYAPSTYGDRIADVYDEWYGPRMDPSLTVEFLADLAGGGRVLELGIGTGRVALPLAERGLDVSGIDASVRMVEKLRAKPGGDRVSVAIGDFSEVPADGRFTLVYIAFTTFFALTRQEDQVRCMGRVADVLEPGGHFVLEAFVPDVARFSGGQSTTTLEAGVDFVHLDAVRHDSVTQTIEGNQIMLREGSTSLYPVRLRYCWPAELDLMGQLAGLVLQSRFAWYDHSVFDARSTRHVSVYTRPRTIS